MISKKKKQRGSALVYILIAIALLAALTATFMDSSSQQTSSQNTFNTVADLNTQVNFIRSAVQECVITYPSGDSALVGTTNIPYPINPSSTYLSSPAASDIVSAIRCPGNPGNSNNHAAIFGGTSGKFLPPPPSLFGAWQYYNGVDGVYISIATNKTDAYLVTALGKLDDQFSECEADVVDARSGNVNMTSAGASGPKCASGNLCFRVWLVAQTSNIYPGDTDGDEAACP